MKMYIRIEGDDDATRASCDVNCSVNFLLNAIIHLFQKLIEFSHGDVTPMLTCLKECADILDKENKGGDEDV